MMFPRYVLAAMVGLAGCAWLAPGSAAAQPSVHQPAASGVQGGGPPAGRASRMPRRTALSGQADSLARLLVFIPHNRSWLTGAARAKRMLVDIGRVDLNLRTRPELVPAYHEAVSARAPLRVGDRLRVHGGWGTSDVSVSGYDVWNGRIVVTVTGDAVVDSVARRVDPLAVAVVRLVGTGTSAATPPPVCDSVSSVFQQRVAFVRDSVTLVLQKLIPAVQAATVKPFASQLSGCFGAARAVIAVSWRSKLLDWSAERVLLVDTTGRAVQLRVSDLRFRVHDLIGVMDADGDGVHDIATRALRERAGGTSILRLDPATRRLTRLTSGFAWEQ